MVFCFLVGLSVRAWALAYRGVIGFDETYYYILGTNLVGGKGYALNGLPHTAFPPLYPLLVGLVGLIVPSARLATAAVSAAAGALLPIPAFILAREVHGRLAGVMAALAASVYPAFFFFASAGLPYSQRLYAGSEPLYVTLFAAGAAFGWLFAVRGGLARAAAAGAFFGLASLVRSEGPVMFAFFFAWLVLVKLVWRQLFKPRVLLSTAAVAISMLAVFSPFLVYVRSVSQQWTLGAKLVNNNRIRGTLWDWVIRNENYGFLSLHYGLNEDGSWMEDPYWGVADWHVKNSGRAGTFRSGLSLVKHAQWRWLPVFAAAFCRGPRALVPWYAWLIIAVGFLFRPWDRRRIRWWGLLACSFAAMALLAVSLYVLPRHELPLVALLTVSVGKGLAEAGRASGRIAARIAPAGSFLVKGAGVLVPAVVLVALVWSGVAQNVAAGGEGAEEAGLANQAQERVLAARLAEMLPAGSKLACMQPWIAVWAGAEWRVPPLAGGDRFLAYAVNRGIEYALLQPWHPALRENAGALRAHIVEEMYFGGAYVLLDFTGGPGATEGPRAGDWREAGTGTNPGGQ